MFSLGTILMFMLKLKAIFIVLVQSQTKYSTV